MTADSLKRGPEALDGRERSPSGKVEPPPITVLLAAPLTFRVPFAGRFFGLGARVSYALANSGDFPVPVLRMGRHLVVTRASMLAVLDPDGSARREASAATTPGTTQAKTAQSAAVSEAAAPEVAQLTLGETGSNGAGRRQAVDGPRDFKSAGGSETPRVRGVSKPARTWAADAAETVAAIRGGEVAR